MRAAVIDSQGRVFLVRHLYAPGWQLPGGGVEVGETCREALARELHEEAAIELAGEPRLHGAFWNGHVSRRDHVLVYEVRAFRVLRPKRPDLEIAEAGFFPLGELPAETTAGTRARLDEILAATPPPATWMPPNRP